MSNFNYKGSLVWINYHNAFYCAFGGLKARTIEGIKELIDMKKGV